jgi:lipopolysaccharide transport system ATP-binding protein
MVEVAPSIQLKRVSKTYKTPQRSALASFFKSKLVYSDKPNSDFKLAVNDVTLKIECGERIGIIGKNGAGKSTLLQIIAGLALSSSGEVLVDGKVTAVMTLGLGLREDLSGRENIYIDGELQGRSRAEIDLLIEEIISFAELEEFIEYPLRTYSTGMKARLAFSMITCISPEILIIDEALSAGDAAFSIKATNKIQEICKRGKIVIVVSHSMRAIKEICDRCIWLENGRIVADGSPDDVTHQYLEATKAADEELLQNKFKSLITNQSVGSSCKISSLELFYRGENKPKLILESGRDVAIYAELELNKPLSHVECLLKIVRLDGLLLVEQMAGESFASNIGSRLGRSKITIELPHLAIGTGIYELSISVTADTELMTRRTLIFEVTSSNQPRGGHPALLYPFLIESRPLNFLERQT